LDDNDQIAQLYRQHAGAARAIAVAITGDPAVADDLVHDAFLRCVSRLGSLRDPEKFRAYLLRAVIHAAASHFRRRGAERRSLERMASRPGPPASATDQGLAGDLLTALQSLPIRQRTAVAARFLLDWSQAQTAAAMGCRVGTVKSLTSRGLAGLRSSFPDREGVGHD
jgi:RNA polymerase sigma factor (sigma-70 family)